MPLFPSFNIEACERIIDYEFRDQALLAQALNASGAALILGDSRVETNRRLAIYGDVAMTKILCAKWFRTGLSQGKTSFLLLQEQTRGEQERHTNTRNRLTSGLPR